MIDVLIVANNAVLLGLCYGAVALSLVCSLRFLNFPDLTIEGSFPLGGALAAVLLIETGSFPVALLGALAGGAIAGCITAALHVFGGVGKLLSGILMISALYSLSLRILGGSNVSLLGVESFFSSLEHFDRNLLEGTRWAIDPAKIGFLLIVMATVLLMAWRFYSSGPGIAIRSIGDNERFLIGLGRDPRPYKFAGLAVSNALAALAGALVAFNQGFADVGMGQGSLVLGLAALIMGEQTVARLLGPSRLVPALLLAAAVGSILYQIAVLLALKAGIAPSDLKLLTAAIVLGVLVWGRGGSAFYSERTF